MSGETPYRIFSAEEKVILIDLIRESKVIEDKRTDVITVSKKKAAWEKIERQFNSNNVSKRTLPQLKKWWDNIKTKRKRDMANEMRQIMKTGGGPPPPAASTIPELETTVSHLGHNIGFCFDSDADTLRPQPGQALSLSPEPSTRKCRTRDLVEQELEMRIKKHRFQVECDEKLQLLWEEELQILAEDARERRESIRKEEERRRQSFKWEEKRRRQAFKREEERKRQAFEREEERKEKAFEAEERRKEEMHLLEMEFKQKST